MVKKSTIILSILFLILLAYIALAAGDGVRIISPSSGSNYTTISNVVFNVSFINGTDITDPQNASFSLNISGVWTTIGNSTCQVSATSSYCGASITNTTIPDGVYSLNATIYNLTTSISVTNTTNLSTIIYIDNTVPAIFSENITSPISNSNRSQNIVLNVSAIDATIGIQTVFFNITNATSGLQNATVTATREGSTSNYAVTINTSHYPDGYYNITVYVNDSLGNLNNTARVSRILFDNTLPSLSHSCDDYSVEEDDVITCTCNPSDSPSGINLSYDGDGKSFTENPSTSSTGNNFPTTCTTQDTAGNFKTSTLYYNVTGGSSGGSSGGGSSGGSTGGTTNNNNNSSTNSTSNSTEQNTNNTSNNANELKGNQQIPNILKNLKINYWILTGVILGAGAIVGAIIVIRKKLIPKFIQYKKQRFK